MTLQGKNPDFVVTLVVFPIVLQRIPERGFFLLRTGCPIGLGSRSRSSTFWLAKHGGNTDVANQNESDRTGPESGIPSVIRSHNFNNYYLEYKSNYFIFVF